MQHWSLCNADFVKEKFRTLCGPPPLSVTFEHYRVWLKKALDGKINNRLKIKDIRELEAGFYKEFGTQGMILAADFSHLRMWIDDKPYVLFLATTFSTVS